MYSIFCFILGSIFGSFIGLCVDRIPRNESIIYPASHCNNCNMPLKKIDLVPIVSFINLRGRCRNCKSYIGKDSFFIEILTGICFCIIGIKYGFSLDFFKYISFTTILIMASAIDLKTFNVYTKVTLSGIVLGIIFIVIDIIVNKYSIKTYIISIVLSLIPALIIVFIILLTESMGWGDVDIFLVSGLFLGFELNLISFMLSFLFGTVGYFIVGRLKFNNMKVAIPFIPFISLACIFAILFGDFILRCYLAYI